jgi:hypothetical protein
MRRHALAARVMAAALSVGLFSSMALAQKQIIVQDDDGGGPQVLQFSMPDFADLRTPDFTRRDLPIFTEELVLSEAQTESIGRMIDGYIEEFRALTKALAETAGPAAEFDPEADEDPTDDMAGRKLAAGLAGAGGPGDLNFDELQDLIPPGTSIGISVGMDAGGMPGDGAAEQPAPRASVQVNLDPPEGEEIPQEVLDKIQQKADDMALRLEDQVQARMNAEVDEDGPAPIKGVGMDEMNMEQMQAKIAGMQEKFEEFRRDKAALRARFVTDAQTNLTEEQVARWNGR